MRQSVIFGFIGLSIGWVAWGNSTASWPLVFVLLLPLGWGYAQSMLKRREIVMPPEMVEFVRNEQIRRLTKFFRVRPVA